MLSLGVGLDVVASQQASAAGQRKTPPRATSSSHMRSGERVDINRAPFKDIEELPGVGTVLAQRIMAGRPYKSVQELRRAGIPPSTVRGLLDRVTTGPGAAAPPAKPQRVAGAGAKQAQGPSAKKSPPQRTFFGIPVGGPRRPAPKAEPARGEDRAPVAAAPRPAAVEPAPAKVPPAEGMVWADPDLKAYYHRGDPLYGMTKHGRFLWEDQAVREGYRAPQAAHRH